MSLIQESAFKRISVGALALTKDKQLITVLGFSSKKVESNMKISEIQALKLSTEFISDD